ncbi:germination protein YpeB [Caldanaerobius polysaccharolyticus]|uniref:germination protein YpeB n=1 Tax=Caldanaerobius polysaccharolyticus TaxID=44256 RepID=UPI0005567BC0|nr:germination protein YpeB [Caldanaerobius polysaccharolyticus]
MSRWTRRIAGLAVLLILAAIAWYQYSDKMFYYRYLEGQYQRSFYELVDHVQSVQSNLAKLMVADSTSQNINLLSDTWRQAYAAQANLSQLPLGAISTINTSKFLSQVGDYASTLMKKQASGQKLDSKDVKNIKDLHARAADITAELQKLRNDVAVRGWAFSGNIKRAMMPFTSTNNRDIVNTGIANVEKQVASYPQLIYDGPFSAHLENVPPKGLTGPDVTQSQARTSAVDFIGSGNVRSVDAYRANNSTFASYGFVVHTAGSAGDGIAVNVSKKGGHVIWMLNQRAIGKASLALPQAEKKALDFLTKRGFKNMASAYSEKYENTAIFNFVPLQSGAIIYPDMVKVKVALDNGEVVGFDAKGYYMNHRDRDLKPPKLTEEEAMKKLSRNLKVQSSRLAVIPLENKVEVLTYEFKGTHAGDTFYVYIDASTGKEVKVLQQVKTYKGDLTM